MKRILIAVFCLVAQNVWCQQQALYYFQDGFKEYQGKFPELTVLGQKGYFADEVVPKFGKELRKVYMLPSNSGLNFDNTKTKDFINGTFALEMYFKYDDGELLLYNQIMGASTKDKQGKYVHLVLTRDGSTKKTDIYLDGKFLSQFIDSENSLEIDAKSNVMFFYSPGNSTSSGSVAMLKLSNFYIDKEQAQNMFKAFNESNLETSDLKKGILHNLYFVKSESRLLPESMPELEQLHLFLAKSPTTKIELIGHTDNVGEYSLNMNLSKNRAEAVKTYLVEKGIAKERIKTNGFGSLKPIADNNSESSRQKNRRVEMRVL